LNAPARNGHLTLEVTGVGELFSARRSTHQSCWVHYDQYLRSNAFGNGMLTSQETKSLDLKAYNLH